MSFVNDFINYVKKAIPTLIRKIGTFLLLVFTLGAFFGFYISTFKDPFYLLFPVIAMIVMYYRLDEGFLVFIVLMIIAFL